MNNNSTSLPSLTIEGAIDESFVFEKISEPLPKRLIVRCRDVSRINSAGIVVWFKFFAGLRKEKVQLQFTECSPAVVRAASHVKGLLMTEEIESLAVPFICEACNTKVQPIYSAEQLKNQNFEVDAVRCPTCSKTTTFDGFERSYFRILSES